MIKWYCERLIIVKIVNEIKKITVVHIRARYINTVFLADSKILSVVGQQW